MTVPIIQSIAEQVDAIKSDQNELAKKIVEKEKKDVWDKLAKLSTFFSSVVIGAAGLWFTHIYETQNTLQRRALQREQLRLSEVTIMEKFIPHLKSDSESQRLSLLMIRTLGHPKLASELGALYNTPGTTEALKTFARIADEKGTIDVVAAKSLIQSLLIAPQFSDSRLPGIKALKVAQQELKSGAREIGGQNSGPWVRKYMKGNDGPNWPWQAGFVSWCFSQPSTNSPFRYTFSNDALMAELREKGLFHSAASNYVPQSGDIMFVMRTPDDAIHVGIVESVDNDIITTIEGNTNDTGAREGYEVARRVRSIRGKAFGHIPNE